MALGEQLGVKAEMFFGRKSRRRPDIDRLAGGAGLEGGEIVSRFRADMAGTLDDESATMSLADLVDCGLVVEDDDETYSLVIEPGSELKLELGVDL